VQAVRRRTEEANVAGTLYLCATPIGNLEDMTFRVIRILKEVDLIAAEDTRNSIKLLNYFEIDTPMTSYHEYNKVEKARKLIEKLKAGKNIALITDAGTPGISDPGEVMVSMCHKENIKVTSLPGAAACITALTVSGLSTRRFCFEAFLPVDNKKECNRIVEELKGETRTIIVYEAPHHLLRTLKLLYENLGNRRITVCRELTKKHETIFVTDFENAISNYEQCTPKGECVIVIEGRSAAQMELEKQEAWQRLDLQEHMGMYLLKGMDKKSAMKQVAKDRGVSKREVYAALVGDNGMEENNE